MFLNISGLNSQLGLRLSDATKSQQMSQLRLEPRNQRAVEEFVEKIGTITTPKELTDNYEVYSFVMRAFDLEDQIFGRGLMRKMLESDPNEAGSLVNRLTDSRFREVHDALGFTQDGTRRPDFKDPTWQDSIIQRYFDQAYENRVADQNSTVGTVLKVRREAPELNNWFQILKDTELSVFFRTALGLPEQMASIDIDKQKALFEKSFDLGTLSDPAVLDSMINRYMAIADIQNPLSSVTTSAISLLRGTGELGVIISLNVPLVSVSASALFR